MTCEYVFSGPRGLVLFRCRFFFRFQLVISRLPTLYCTCTCHLSIIYYGRNFEIRFLSCILSSCFDSRDTLMLAMSGLAHLSPTSTGLGAERRGTPWMQGALSVQPLGGRLGCSMVILASCSILGVSLVVPIVSDAHQYGSPTNVG